VYCLRTCQQDYPDIKTFLWVWGLSVREILCNVAIYATEHSIPGHRFLSYSATLAVLLLKFLNINRHAKAEIIPLESITSLAIIRKRISIQMLSNKINSNTSSCRLVSTNYGGNFVERSTVEILYAKFCVKVYNLYR
jgi:hypothetical protein